MTSNISRALVGTAATTLLALGPLAGLAQASDDDYSCGNDNDGYVEEYADYFGSTADEHNCEDGVYVGHDDYYSLIDVLLG